MERKPEIIMPNRITVGGPNEDKTLIGVEAEFIPPKVFEIVDKHPAVVTPRQREIAQQIIAGNTVNEQIGQSLGIAENTVLRHIQRMKHKLKERDHDFSGPNPRTLKIKLILALMQEGELVLRDPQ